MLPRIIAVTCLLSLAAVVPAPAQGYPSRSVEIIVPFAPGGATDVMGRLIGDGLSKRLGQSFVPINRPGANTNIGTLQAVRSAPDGHTLLMASFGLAANPSLYRKLPFTPLSDLAPITMIANSPSILVVHPSLPVRTVAELIAYLKAHPGELNYASYGPGSSPHLGAELFQALTGTKLVHVPYNGGGPAAMAVVGNNVQVLISSVVSAIGLVRGGQLRPIALAADARSPLLPDLPTFVESGLPFRSGTWYGLLAPAKTPEAIIATLHRQTVELLREPTVRARIAEQGADVIANTPGEFRVFLKEETERLAVVIRNANLQLD